MDHAWWAADTAAIGRTDRMQAFFQSTGIDSYGQLWQLDGTLIDGNRGVGLVASNGAASLAAPDPRAWLFVERLWRSEPISGNLRYYGGLLQFMAFLHASGNFRIY